MEQKLKVNHIFGDEYNFAVRYWRLLFRQKNLTELEEKSKSNRAKSN